MGAAAEDGAGVGVAGADCVALRRRVEQRGRRFRAGRSCGNGRQVAATVCRRGAGRASR